MSSRRQLQSGVQDLGLKGFKVLGFKGFQGSGYGI